MDELDLNKLFACNSGRKLREVNDYIASLETAIVNLKQELKKYDKDIEITKRDAEIENLQKHAIISTDDKTRPILESFIKKHYKKCGNGNHYIYDVTGTGLGPIISVYCGKCNEDIDISPDF
jgi:hypothetical protein